MNTIEKKDPLTGEVFIPLRANQVFANDENRIRFNNLKAKTLRKSKSKIDHPLRDNYRILIELLEGKKEAIFHKQYLLGKGYNFSVITHNTVLNGKNHIAIYDFALVAVDCEKIKIVRI